MPIRRPEIPVSCDYCDNSYICYDGVLQIRPGWKVIKVDGEEHVACPRHEVVNLVAPDPVGSLEAMDAVFEEALKGARRAGRSPAV